MSAHVVVRVTTSERGTNKLPAITMLLEEVMNIDSMDVSGVNSTVVRYNDSGAAVFVGHTQLSLAQFTAALYGSPLQALIRDVSYNVERGLPRTDLQERNREMLAQQAIEDDLGESM